MKFQTLKAPWRVDFTSGTRRPAPGIRRTAVRARYALTAFVPLATTLLAHYKLSVPPQTVEMLAKTIQNCRLIERPSNKKSDQELSTRRRLTKVLRHARMLLGYIKRSPSHANSISKRSAALRAALDSWDVVIWVAAANPLIDVPKLMIRLDTDRLNAVELLKLVRALESPPSAPTRTGRPLEQRAKVIRAGCIAWLRAEKKLSYSWNPLKDRTGGRLAIFLRDLLRTCKIAMSEAALYSALRTAAHNSEQSLT